MGSPRKSATGGTGGQNTTWLMDSLSGKNGMGTPRKGLGPGTIKRCRQVLRGRASRCQCGQRCCGVAHPPGNPCGRACAPPRGRGEPQFPRHKYCENSRKILKMWCIRKAGVSHKRKAGEGFEDSESTLHGSGDPGGGRRRGHAEIRQRENAANIRPCIGASR